ncbi:hypothetical protein, partial [Streptomyces sp. NPDC005568]|uniref:hypothetical protein n=1 Tax=Streptomyces sp. NPDC005568 TaxID=3156887 RepID=UPI0033A4D071
LSLLPFVLIVVVFLFLMNQMQGGGSRVMNFGNTAEVTRRVRAAGPDGAPVPHPPHGCALVRVSANITPSCAAPFACPVVTAP